LTNQEEQEAKKRNVSLEQYKKQYLNMDDAKFNETLTENAKKNIKIITILDKMTEEFNIVAEDKDVEKALEDFAKANRYPLDIIKKQMQNNPAAKEQFEYLAKQEKLFDYISDKVNK
jgi:FKBP-type peptidyl-prolyl cis-trans isomerase (trigger factor)